MSQRLSCSGEGGRSSGLERSGLALLRFLRRKPAPPPGTLRWAQFLPDEKLGKESLRAFPPKDLPGVRGCPCVKSRFGPSPLLWPLFVPPHQATLGSWPYGWVVSTSGPTLPQRRSRRRSSPPHHRSCIFHYSFFIHHYSTSIFNSSTLRDGFRAKLTAYPSTRDKSATRLSTSRGVTNSSRPGASSGARSPSRS